MGDLATNLKEHKCNAQIVKGTIGSKPYKLIRPNKHAKYGNVSGYGKFIVDVSDPRPGTIVPAHSVKSLNVTFDTLAIDCEGCFGHFLEEKSGERDTFFSQIAAVLSTHIFYHILGSQKFGWVYRVSIKIWGTISGIVNGLEVLSVIPFDFDFSIFQLQCANMSSPIVDAQNGVTKSAGTLVIFVTIYSKLHDPLARGTVDNLYNII